MAVNVTCSEAADIFAAYVWMPIVVAGILNVCSVLIILFILMILRKFPSTTRRFSALTIQLSQAAIRSSLGPSARKAMIESARANPKLAHLTKGLE